MKFCTFVLDIVGEVVDLSVLSTPEDVLKVSILSIADSTSLVTSLQLPDCLSNECTSRENVIEARFLCTMLIKPCYIEIFVFSCTVINLHRVSM